MKQKKIHDISINGIDQTNPMVGYTDGDCVIVDNVKQLDDINPLRPNYNFIILCCKGRVQLDVNGKTLRLNQNEVLLSSPNVILDNFMFSSDFECKILCLSERIIYSLLHEEIEIWNKAVYVNRTNTVRLPDEEIEQFELYYALIKQKLKIGTRAFSIKAMQALIKGLLIDFCVVLDSNNAHNSSYKVSQGKILFDRFLSMITAQKVKRRPVGYYANELAVTPKYLTMVCESYSKKSASEWINQYVMEDVRHALKNTSMSMKEIAAQLGFANNSHFGTYVRRYFGMSPTVYRQSLSN